ncbi:MAG TPA: carboxypeptidase-like regulatory domain-containing protein [Fulvivirga sp.]|nr:carboxypeptidase-like regulatory domain-containing protein [Fulvivirga sp.]
MRTIIYPILIALSFLSFTSQAQLLTGTVVDQITLEPLVGANLYLKSNWRKGTSTDVNGEFAISVSKVDTLIVSYIGYKELQVPFSKAEVSLTIKLPQNITNIDEVVVKAEKLIAEEFTYRKVQRLDIYTNPSAKADPLLAVNSLPSSTTLDESANISFRGSSPVETGIFMNNVPIYDAIRFSQLNGIGTFSIFNTAIVDNMQVFPGNPPLEYGNTTSGLIAIQSTEQVPKVAINSATVTLASFGLLTSRPIGKKTGITVFSNFQPSEFIRGINQEALASIKKFRSFDLGINAVRNLSDNSILKIFNYSLYEGYDFQYEAPTYSGIFNQQKKRNFTIANWRKRINQSEFTINGNLSYSKAQFGYSDTDITIKNHDTFISANYQFFGASFDVKTGFTYDFRGQQFNGTFYTYDYAEGPGYPFQHQQSEQHVHRPEVYSYAKYYLGNKWIVGAGLRKNIPSSDQKSYLSGQVNTNYKLSDQFSINAGIGKYNKYALSQNENSSAYFIESKQASIDFSYQQDVTELTLSVFNKENKQGATTTNIIGTELFIKGKLFKNLTAQTSITYINGTSQNSTNNKKYESNYDLSYFIKGSLKYKPAPLFEITTTFLLRDGRYYQPLIGAAYYNDLNAYEPQYASIDNRTRLPDYNVIDLSISRLFPVSEKVTIITFASLSNVLNTKNVRGYIYNFDYSVRQDELFSQRTVYFGTVINF